MDTDTHSIVSLRGLRKVFGENEVLKGIDLDIAEGEVVVIFGRSGSGKSTLLRCINFLEEPTAGSVEWTVSATRPGRRAARGARPYARFGPEPAWSSRNSIFPASERDRERRRGPDDGQGDAQGGGRRARDALSRAGGRYGQAGRVPDTPLRGSEAAGRHRAPCPCA